MISQYENHQISKSSSQISVGISTAFVSSMQKFAGHTRQLVLAKGLPYSLYWLQGSCTGVATHNGLGSNRDLFCIKSTNVL